MRRQRTPAGAAPTCLLAAVLFCAAFLGCNNYCVVVMSNPGGTVNTNSNCPNTTSTGTVSVNIGAAASVDAVSIESASAPVRAPHIFVTLRGLDALAMQAPGAEAPAWQELAPQLAERPVQVDLAARAEQLCAAAPLWSAKIPSGVYSQLRLRLVPNASTSESPARSGMASRLDASACGANLLDCLVPPGAAALPLACEDAADIAIPADRIAGGFIRVLPNTTTHLTISLDPVFSRAVPAGDSLRMIPVFSVSTQPSCHSPE